MKSNEFDELKTHFYEYHSRLVLFAYKFSGDIEIAKDIVQDAFISVWENYDRILQKSSIKTYLFQTVKNKCLNHIRHINITQSVEEQLKARIDTAEKYTYFDFHDPYHSLLEKELFKTVDSVMELLPEKCHEVFILSRKHQLKNQEIADKMGISVKMVEKQISKALMILRKELKNSWDIILFLLGITTR